LQLLVKAPASLSKLRRIREGNEMIDAGCRIWDTASQWISDVDQGMSNDEGFRLGQFLTFSQDSSVIILTMSVSSLKNTRGVFDMYHIMVYIGIKSPQEDR
jgi:hypothetical protein